jgi:hypothetical protein
MLEELSIQATQALVVLFLIIMAFILIAAVITTKSAKNQKPN